ncbi:MAG: TIGR04086 family membrane protein [Clostridiaceae bacterium]|nr:TIGR04086 family membrane protein [Clostridiaceae bacterium]
MLEKSGLRSGTAKSGFGFSQALLTAFAITIPAMFILAAILTFTDFPEKYKTIAVLIATLSSLFVAGFKTGVHNEKNGMIRGALTGFAYMLILYIASSIIFNDFILNPRSVIMIITGILAGAIGGIIGINRKSKPLSRVNRFGKGNDLLKKYRR